MQRWETNMRRAFLNARAPSGPSPLAAQVIRKLKRGLGTFTKKKFFHVVSVPKDVKKADRAERKALGVQHVFPRLVKK